MAEDAAAFFFPAHPNWTSLTEIRLKDRHGRSAGNIDIVLVSYDESGRILDFGSLEVQAVYISGNVRSPFERYMRSRTDYLRSDWPGPNYPRPDFLSSSRKRLAPQLIYKGGILSAWGKKQAVAVDTAFFSSLPTLPVVGPDEADVVWLVYNTELGADGECRHLVKEKVVYTSFKPVLDRITTSAAGPVGEFVATLQDRIDEQLEDGNPPDAPLLTDILGV